MTFDEKSKIIKKMVAGGLAGQICWFFGYPFDIIKTMAQTSNKKQGFI
jgi:hypothetical protein